MSDTATYSQREDGQLKAIIGKSRCGKTALAHEIMEGVPRILAWDPQGQIGMNPGFENFRDLRALVKRVQRNEEDHSPMKLAFQFGTKDRFNTFARIAYAWGVQGPGLVMIDEIGDVVSAGNPGPAWGTLVRAGLKYEINLVAMTQRPQRVDKDVTDNATELVVFHQGKMAASWLQQNEGVPLDKIPTEKYRYFVRRDDEWSGPFTTKQI